MLRSIARKPRYLTTALKGGTSSVGHSLHLLFPLAEAGGQTAFPYYVLIKAVMLVGLRITQLSEEVTSGLNERYMNT